MQMKSVLCSVCEGNTNNNEGVALWNLKINDL